MEKQNVPMAIAPKMCPLEEDGQHLKSRTVAKTRDKKLRNRVACAEAPLHIRPLYKEVRLRPRHLKRGGCSYSFALQALPLFFY